MGKGGRIACIITPYLLTIATLICIIIVGLGCTKASSSTLSNLYFLRIDLSNLTNGTDTTSEIENLLEEFGITSVNASEVEDLVQQLASNEADSLVKEFYDIGLWGYCDGDIRDGDFETTHCSKPKSEFYFDPLSVWGLDNSTAVKDELPSDYNKDMKIYKAVSKWMFIAYIIAFILTIVELLVGFFAICSRWGSCVTTLFAFAALIFTAAASITATVLFVVFRSTLGNTLKAYGIKLSLGKNMFATTWLAVAFSLAATFFWVFSVCCCSGRSPYNHKNRNRGLTAEKAPYTYEPIGATGALPPQQHHTSYPPPPNNSYPMTHQQPHASPYEPFRHS